MPKCNQCGGSFGFLDLRAGECPECREKAAAAKARPDTESVEKAKAEKVALARIILTTETAHNLPIAKRLDIISAEVVIGMHLFKDIAGVFRDVFGGRSKVMQDGLREARKSALDELRREAHALGADAVVGIDLDYSEISGGGKSMLFLVASGTAVTLTSLSSTQ